MIDRYTTPEMGSIWSEEAKIRVWARVEIEAARVQDAPSRVISALEDPASWPTVEQCRTQEVETRHDVVAFVQAWRQNLDVEVSAWVHRNMTSSDLVDSATALRLDQCWSAINRDLTKLVATLARHAQMHRDTVRVARTHGQHAELSTWGYRVAGFAHSLERSRYRFAQARDWFATGKLSGPVGTYQRVTFEQETRFLQALRLEQSPVTTQVVPRDGIADFVWSCAQVVAAIEELALEVRLCQRSEVGELAEGFAPGQRGSSAMPHKKNPITAERLCGLSRLVRGLLGPVLEGVALHHERDLAHSSVERVALVEAATLTHFAVLEADRMWNDLVVNADRMRANAERAANLALSALVKDHLVASGVDPNDAWELVHAASQNPNGNLVEETRLVMRRRLAGVISVDDVDWRPLIKASLMTLISRTGNTSHVFDELPDLA